MPSVCATPAWLPRAAACSTQPRRGQASKWPEATRAPPSGRSSRSGSPSTDATKQARNRTPASRATACILPDCTPRRSQPA
eukprot:423760-Alexandrium_andersonii.AAC.1